METDVEHIIYEEDTDAMKRAFRAVITTFAERGFSLVNVASHQGDGFTRGYYLFFEQTFMEITEDGES